MNACNNIFKLKYSIYLCIWNIDILVDQSKENLS